MTPERWRRIEDVYHAALARGAEERGAFVAEACAGDEALWREVVSLLAQHASLAGTLEGAAVGMAAPNRGRLDEESSVYPASSDGPQSISSENSAQRYCRLKNAAARPAARLAPAESRSADRAPDRS
jgi:hypothetical protein